MHLFWLITNVFEEKKNLMMIPHQNKKRLVNINQWSLEISKIILCFTFFLPLLIVTYAKSLFIFYNFTVSSHNNLISMTTFSFKQSQVQNITLTNI